MKKLLYAISGALSCFVLIMVLTSYDHELTHKEINGTIIDGFEERYFSSINKNDLFHYYRFLLSGSGTMEGDAVISGGKLNITTGTLNKNAKDWVRHGGRSADEPQLPASFVHFYDPTQKEGEQYLKDLLDSWYLSWGIENPKTDHVSWAISDDRNEYNYEAAKQHFKNALEQSAEDFRHLNMSHAWRAFGQTLHLIADMGIASHVRDDAHPGVGAGLIGHNWALDADPYEEIVYKYLGKNGIDNLLKGKVDPKVEKFSKEAKTVKEIAEKLAEYTNENFFSHETISGANVTPKIHPDKTYPSPKLEDCSYNSTRNIYTKNIGGNSVVMCKDLSYLAAFNNFRGYPYIDEECVISQATALFPQIKEAGINALRLFIPKIKVEVTALGDNHIEGKVTHTTDDEYKEEIKYNGPVVIKKASNLSKIGVVNCENGEFDADINLGSFDPTSEELIAEIECGYVYIRSEPFTQIPEPKWRYVQLVFKKVDGIWDFSRNGVIEEGSKGVSLSNSMYLRGDFKDGVFTLDLDTVISGYPNKLKATFEIDNTRQRIIRGSFSKEVIPEDNPEHNFDYLSFEVYDIPAKNWTSNYGLFQLHAEEVCNSNNLRNVRAGEGQKLVNTKFVWELKTYSCNDYSDLSISFRETKL